MLENFSIKNWQNGINGLGIEISSDCNLRCKYCYYYRSSRADDDNALNVVKDSDFYKNMGPLLDKIFIEFKNIRHLDFWGAEPLLHIPRIQYIIEHIIDSNRFKVFGFLVSSNMAHNREVYDKLFTMFDFLEDKLKNSDMIIKFSLQTSIDFPKQIHDKNRVTIDDKPTFSKVKHNYISVLKRLGKKNYKHIEFSTFTKSTYNYANIDLKAIEEMPDSIIDEIIHDLPILAKTKSDYKDFNFNIDYFATPATGIPYTLEDGLKNYVFYKKVFDNFERLYLSGTLTYANAMYFLPGALRIFISELLNLTGFEKVQYSVCRSGISFMGIKNNGDIFPCHHFFSVKNRNDFRIGNLFTEEYNDEMLLTILNTYYLISETFKDFEEKVFNAKYSKNLNYGSHEIISSVFYKFLIRHFCFADNCESKNLWSAIDLDALLKLYPVQWLELCLEFITKYRRVFEAVSEKQTYATFGLGS